MNNKEIYGITKGEKITPIKIRNAILVCFKKAHKKEFEQMKEYGHFKSEEEFESFKQLDVELLLKNAFNSQKGDFKNPTKEDLQGVVKYLEEFSAHFRKPEVIKKHASEIKQLINQLD